MFVFVYWYMDLYIYIYIYMNPRSGMTKLHTWILSIVVVWLLRLFRLYLVLWILWDWCELFLHIFLCCFTCSAAIVWLPHYKWINPEWKKQICMLSNHKNTQKKSDPYESTLLCNILHWGTVPYTTIYHVLETWIYWSVICRRNLNASWRRKPLL